MLKTLKLALSPAARRACSNRREHLGAALATRTEPGTAEIPPSRRGIKINNINNDDDQSLDTTAQQGSSAESLQQGLLHPAFAQGEG